MDMMRPISVSAPPTAVVLSGTRTNNQDNLAWANARQASGFIVQRAAAPTGPWTDMGTLPENAISYSSAPPDLNPYSYQVVSVNAVGYGATAGYSTLTTQSAPSNVVTLQSALAAPAAPRNVVATAITGPAGRLTWMDNATNESGFVIQRCQGANCTNFAPLATVGSRFLTGSVTYNDTTVVAGQTYTYRVAATRRARPVGLGE